MILRTHSHETHHLPDSVWTGGSATDPNMSTQNKFTPGPWHIDKDGDGCRFTICSETDSRALQRWVAAGNSGGFAGNGSDIASVKQMFNGSGAQSGPSALIDCDEVEANARLIAAAPDMFAALEYAEPLLNVLVGCIGVELQNASGHSARQWNETKAKAERAITQARAALAKARWGV